MPGSQTDASRPQRATIADVAALAGVSRAAVSKVFNASGHISPETSARIREAARTLNWTPSVTAAALRHARSQTVGLVLNRPGELEIGTTSSLLISGMESVLAPRNYGLLLYLIDRNQDDEVRTYRTMAHDRRVDGVVLTDSRVGDERFALTRSLGLPAVLIGTPLGGEEIPHLDSDPPGAGVDDAVQHLVALGHRAIAYIGGPDDRVQARLRREMFEQTMADARLQPVASVTTQYAPDSAAAHTAAVLDSAGSRPTAIVYGSDTMAIAGINAARSRGLSVPEDLSVVGFDGLPIGAWLQPSLTTVQRDAVQRGRAVATTLLEILGEHLDEKYEITRPHLVVRESTGPAPG